MTGEFMLTKRRIAELSEQVAGESLFHYFCGRSGLDFQHPLLKALYGSEPLRSKTALQGLLTSLGVTLWERLAKQLASENGFEVQDPKSVKQPEFLPPLHRELLNRWSEKRKADAEIFSLEEMFTELKDERYSVLEDIVFRKLTKSDGIDVFLTQENVDFYFDIKTVDWNAGASYKFNAALLNWIVFHRIQRPGHDLQPYFVIPYGIHENWWQKVGPKVSPLHESDILIGDAFWNLITGIDNSLCYITEGFENFAKRDGIRDLYSKLLTQGSPELDLDLIQLHRSVSFLSKAKTKNGKPSKSLENWNCLHCGEDFSATRKKVVCSSTPCPFCEPID